MCTCLVIHVQRRRKTFVTQGSSPCLPFYTIYYFIHLVSKLKSIPLRDAFLIGFTQAISPIVACQILESKTIHQRSLKHEHSLASVPTVSWNFIVHVTPLHLIFPSIFAYFELLSFALVLIISHVWSLCVVSGNS